MPKCPNCQENVPKKQRFCGFCGTDVTTGEKPDDLSFFDGLGKQKSSDGDYGEESFFAKQRREAVAAGAPIIEKPKPKVEIPPEIAKNIGNKQVDETELEMRMKGVWQQDTQSEKIAEKLKNKETNDMEIAIAKDKKNKAFLSDLPPIGIPKAPAPAAKTASPVNVPPVVNIPPVAQKSVPPVAKAAAAPVSKPAPPVVNVPPTASKPVQAFPPSSQFVSMPKNVQTQPPPPAKPAPQTEQQKHVSKFDAFDSFVPKKHTPSVNSSAQPANAVPPINPAPTVLPPPAKLVSPPPVVTAPVAKKAQPPIEPVINSTEKTAPTPQNVAQTDNTETNDNIRIPDVTGMTKETAKAMLTRAGLKPVLQTINDESAPKGTIVSQDIKAGEYAQEGSTVTVLVSVGSWSKWTKDPYLSDEKHQIESKTIYRYRSREKFIEEKESDKNTMTGFDLYNSKKEYSNWDTDKYYSKESRPPSDTCEILKINTGFKYFGWTYHGIDSISNSYCSLETAMFFNPKTTVENWEYNETIDKSDAPAETKNWSPEKGFDKTPAGDEVESNFRISSYYIGGIEYASRVGLADTVWTKYRKRKLEKVTYMFKAEKYSAWSVWSEWSLDPDIEPDELNELEAQTLYRRRRKADVS
ncbi:hypothetical protein FACS1894132_10550 [Clostridia bacterium]|nr:hypothetical protein FACS1894132_10550 [Clostridia bacterium]